MRGNYVLAVAQAGKTAPIDSLENELPDPTQIRRNRMFGWLGKMFRTRPKVAWDNDFLSSVAGTSFRNRDGTSRQKVINGSVYEGMKLIPVPEPENKHDRNAVALMIPDGRQIGYLDKGRTAMEVAEWLSQGRVVLITVDEVTGGYGDKPTSGVNIRIRVGPQPVRV